MENTETPAGEEGTGWSQEILELRQKVLDARKKVAIKAARLQENGSFCSSGLTDFYRDHGIPLRDRYNPLDEAKSWDGHLTGRWAGLLDLMMTVSDEGSLDPADFSDLGMAKLAAQLTTRHEEWMSSCRDAAISEYRMGRWDERQLASILKAAGLRPAVKSIAGNLTLTAAWTGPVGSELSGDKLAALNQELSTAVDQVLTRHLKIEVSGSSARIRSDKSLS